MYAQKIQRLPWYVLPASRMWITEMPTTATTPSSRALFSSIGATSWSSLAGRRLREATLFAQVTVRGLTPLTRAETARGCCRLDP
jgi:hypothetical protein